MPVVTQIPQGWSPDSQITAHSLPTCISSTHSESFVCDSLLTPCARLRWQEVNLWHHGPLHICIIPRTCLRLQEIKLRRRGPPNSSSTSSANFRWQEDELRHPDPQCLHELFKITASSDWKPASKPLPPPQGHEPMVHPLVLLTVGCFLHELGLLLPYCNTQPTLALTVALTTALPLQFDFTSSPRVISKQNQPAQEADSCHGFHLRQIKLNCITPRPKLNLRSSQHNHHPHNSSSPHTISKKKTPAPQVFSHLYQNTDVLFGQELLKPSSLPPPYCHSSLAKTWYNLPKTGEKSRGTAIYVSDCIAPFCTPIEHVDREGLMTLLLLLLPGSPPTLLISLYCPPHDTRLRQIISEALDVLLPKYPSHIISGDFNTSINLSLDTENITSSNAWPRLSNKVNKQPPALHDTFRDKHPHLKKCSRYWSTNHQNQARLDYIFASPQFTSTHPILDADIETSNFFQTTTQRSKHAQHQSYPHLLHSHIEHLFFGGSAKMKYTSSSIFFLL